VCACVYLCLVLVFFVFLLSSISFLCFLCVWGVYWVWHIHATHVSHRHPHHIHKYMLEWYMSSCTTPPIMCSMSLHVTCQLCWHVDGWHMLSLWHVDVLHVDMLQWDMYHVSCYTSTCNMRHVTIPPDNFNHWSCDTKRRVTVHVDVLHDTVYMFQRHLVTYHCVTKCQVLSINLSLCDQVSGNSAQGEDYC